ncbi:MKI67 FHA domain-interacting nucleolar phosphoprotein-like [Corticium candelabrum]|uniref:MKI67 FHA domain-interacting nucleolar phosphoprotein-like n=1 Tax=Corticium candelabrum TaxID=121492 RepID=UPI002E2588D2|nr:MKI67 FHA domain-interacting nucleolar phosphoprotein-like [Corticium candelabrum]
MASKRSHVARGSKKQLKVTRDSPRGTEGGRGVMYVGHIPHGFYEEQMKKFFSQFGHVTRVRLARSKKTANSKGYAFLEFEFDEVAQIAAETMNNYLMFGKLLKCNYIPPGKVHPYLFKGAGRALKRLPRRKIFVQQYNRPRTVEEHSKLVRKLVKKEDKKRDKMKEVGIEYEFPGYRARLTAEAKHMRFT